MRVVSFLLSLVRLGVFSGFILGGVGILAGLFLVFHTIPGLPKLPEDLGRIIDTPETLVYAASGQVVKRLGQRKSVPLSRVAPDFINAVLATEDHLFFQHHGINKLRTLKGLYVTLFEEGRVEGASTITQQLAKNMFFTFEQSFERKFKELLVAFQIEAANSKETILEAYINQIYFGAGAKGVERAAQVFLGKSAMELSLSEAALLAGLPKSPTAYNPFHHYDRAMKRRNLVLRRMKATGFIPAETAEAAMAEEIVLRPGKSGSDGGSYFLDALVRDLVEKYGENVVFHGGLRVYTTLEPRLQELGETALQRGLENLADLMGLPAAEEQPGPSPELPGTPAVVQPQGALVAVDTATGAVKALVGGRDYLASEFNRAVHALRQPGSGFKPFLYYAAFQNLGLHPATIMTDRPVIVPVVGAPDWEPRNFKNVFRGDMILKTALTKSVNTIAAQMVQLTGPEQVIETAKKCGIESALNPVYSIALGASGVTVLEMASAYCAFANQGIVHDPFLFWRVEDAFGRVLFEHIVRNRQALEPATAFQVVDMMKAVVDTGSGRSIRALGFKRPCAGKTGTTNDYNDAWFTGFTPSLCTSVWTGFDRKRPLRDRNGTGITGGRAAAPIWADFMIRALNGEPERDFVIPEQIRFEAVDPATGCRLPDDPGAGGLPGIPAAGMGSIRIPLKTGQEICGEAVP